MQEERLNIAPFVDPLLRWWRVILTCMLIFTMSSGVLEVINVLVTQQERSSLQDDLDLIAQLDFDEAAEGTEEAEPLEILPTATPVPEFYEAVAGINVVRFDATVKTEDPTAHLAPLVGLVSNSTIAERVLAELHDDLTPEERQPATLLSQVRGSAAGPNLIEIIVAHEEPEKAALIANAWANAYEQFVNESYARTTTNSDALETELARARENYENAQHALLQFRAKGGIEETRRAIREKEGVLDVLSTMQSEVISSTQEVDTRIINTIYEAYRETYLQNVLFAFESEQQRNRALLKAYMDTQTNAQVGVFLRQAAERQRVLDEAYAARALVDGFLQRARVLRGIARQGGDPALLSPALTRLTLEIASASPTVEPLIIDSDGDLIDPDLLRDDELQDLRAAQNAPEQQVDETGQTIEDYYQSPDHRVSLPSVGEPANTDLPNTQLTISPPNLAPEQALAQTEALVAALESRLTEIDATITQQQEIILNDEQLALAEPTDESELWTRIRQTHTALYERGKLGQLSEEAASSSFATSSQSLMNDLLTMQNQGDLLAISTADTPLNHAITSLQNDISDLRFELTQKTLKEQELMRENQLASLTYKSLQSQVMVARSNEMLPETEIRVISQASVPTTPGRARQDEEVVNEAIAEAEARAEEAELALETAVIEAATRAEAAARAESEARIADLVQSRNALQDALIQANERIALLESQQERLPVLPLGVLLGLVLGIMSAYMLDYLGPSAVPQRLWGPPDAVWNRAFRWALTPAVLPAERGIYPAVQDESASQATPADTPDQPEQDDQR